MTDKRRHISFWDAERVWGVRGRGGMHCVNAGFIHNTGQTSSAISTTPLTQVQMVGQLSTFAPAESQKKSFWRRKYSTKFDSNRGDRTSGNNHKCSKLQNVYSADRCIARVTGNYLPILQSCPVNHVRAQLLIKITETVVNVMLLTQRVFAIPNTDNKSHNNIPSQFCLATKTQAIFAEQNPSWKADSRSASHEISRLLLWPKVQCRAHTRTPLYSIHRQLTPVRTPFP
jgi:hypothetical protein